MGETRIYQVAHQEAVYRVAHREAVYRDVYEEVDREGHRHLFRTTLLRSILPILYEACGSTAQGLGRAQAHLKYMVSITTF
jgi:hypothetical protein